MIVLVPMGGLGSRFSKVGYLLPKPAIPVTDRHSGLDLPMVVAAMNDVPAIHEPSTRILCVGREDYARSGLEAEILARFPKAAFIHDHAQLGQAFACLLAREHLRTHEELIVASCDAGIDIDPKAFADARRFADALMLSHSGDENIAHDPTAHSWADLAADGKTLRRISIKTPVSAHHMSDHATTGLFWFRDASVFLSCLEETLFRGDHPAGCHVDHVLQRFIDRGLTVSFIDVTYYCWGTPRDYRNYQATYQYWAEYVDENPWISARSLHRHSLPQRAAQHPAVDGPDFVAAGKRRA